jgi:hypothetical protein
MFALVEDCGGIYRPVCRASAGLFFVLRVWKYAVRFYVRIQVFLAEHQSAVQTVMRNGPFLGPPTKCGDRAAEPSRCHCNSEEAPWR